MCGRYHVNGETARKIENALADLIMCLILSLGLISPLITVMGYSDDIAKAGTIIGEVAGILSWEELGS